MNNAEKFKQMFGFYATEMWAKSEQEFLDWINAEYQENSWIPCSERPPKEEDGMVLITLDGEVTTAIYSEFSKTWYIGDMCGVSNRVPTAWMPRPEPYKGEEL